MLELAPVELWRAYEAAADSNSLLTDVLTAGSINSVSDTVAQLTERKQFTGEVVVCQDVARTTRFVAFGLADGAVSHAWFLALDAIIGEDGSVAETLLKVASDALVYTPLWCIWFLAAFVVLEQRGVRSIPSVVRGQWLELFRGNLGFFLPLTGLIYAFVPRDERVLAFGAASLVYTTILSVWQSAQTAEEGEFGLCALDDEDDDGECVPLPRPPRTSAALSFGLRQVIVKARRAAPPRMAAEPPPPEGPTELPLTRWRARLEAFLADVLVVEATDSIRQDSGDKALATAKAVNASRVFSWGGTDGDDTLRLPKGVAAAERLGVNRVSEELDLSPALRQPALRDDQIEDARKSPAVVLAVLLIIVFQATGSLIGLSREVLPEELLGAASMEESATPPLELRNP